MRSEAGGAAQVGQFGAAGVVQLGERAESEPGSADYRARTLTLDTAEAAEIPRVACPGRDWRIVITRNTHPQRPAQKYHLTYRLIMNCYTSEAAEVHITLMV